MRKNPLRGSRLYQMASEILARNSILQPPSRGLSYSRQKQIESVYDTTRKTWEELFPFCIDVRQQSLPRLAAVPDDNGKSYN